MSWTRSSASAPERAGVLLLLAALVGCAGAPYGADGPVPEDDPTLALVEGQRCRLRTDLPAPVADEVLARLDALEALLDAAYPFLPAPARPPLALVVADPARFSLHARRHDAPDAAGAFVTPAGVLVGRYRPEEWAPGPPFPLEPRIRPLAAAALRRRRLAAYGPDLERSWLEDGLAADFVGLAARETGEAALLEREERERLLDAYLPLFLGEAPALERVVGVTSAAARQRTGSPAQALAAVRFLLRDPELTRALALGLEVAAGLPDRDGPWAEARARLRAREADFERDLQAAVLESLLDTLERAPTPVDRWEAAAALRLLANIDLDADAPDPERQALVGATRQMLAGEVRPPVRFLDRYADEVAAAAAARSRFEAMGRLKRRIELELERRSKGYGHPAVEQARRGLGAALDRMVQARAGS